MASYDVIANQPVVIDNGSGSIKAGFAGDQAPKCQFSNFVGRPKHTKAMATGIEGDLFIGPKAQEHRGLLSIKYPMEHGIVTDWNDMERIWQYIYSNDQLKAEPSEHPVLLTEAPLNPQFNREKASEIFFETFNVPALCIQTQAILSLYTSGRSTGVVLDSGDGVTHIVPIYEGYVIESGIQRIDVAGRDVTRYLRLLLRKEGHVFHRSSEFEIVRELKEQRCKILPSAVKDEVPSDSTKLRSFLQDIGNITHTLPDGSKIELGSSIYRAPEVLFRPELIGQEYEGIPQCLANAIFMCDFDLRKSLYQSIILSGGSTLFSGFGDRLLAELRKIAPKDVKIRIMAPQDRVHSTWIGGSIVASLETFRRIWISKQQYENQGKPILSRKAF